MPALRRESSHSRPWLRPPQLRTVGGEQGERHASWLELFFDLVFVVAIAQLAHELVVDHGLGGFARFGALFLPVYIAWQGFSFYADRFDTDDVIFRVAMLAAMLAIAALAVQIPDVVAGRSVGFALSYVVLRSIMIGLYLRTWRAVPQARPLVRRYATAYSLGAAAWLVSLAVPSPWRFVIWGVALAWEYAQPVLSRRFHVSIPVDTSHVPERLALFTLIVLGESVVAVALGVAGEDWRAASVAAAVLGFVTSASLWWVYFDLGVSLGLRRTSNAILVFTHVHIPLLAALTAVSAGVELLIEESTNAHLASGTRWALCGGAAVYLACLAIVQSATPRGVARQVVAARGAAIAALLVLGVASAQLTPVATAALLAAVLVALVLVEIARGQPAGDDQAAAAPPAIAGRMTSVSSSATEVSSPSSTRTSSSLR